MTFEESRSAEKPTRSASDVGVREKIRLISEKHPSLLYFSCCTWLGIYENMFIVAQT